MSPSSATRRARRFVNLVGVLLAALAGVLPATADAAPREWHVGASAGYVGAGRGLRPGPGLGVYGAYGLFGSFDARLDVRGSLHSIESDPDETVLVLATAGLSYRLDIIQWIPHLGARIGYYEVGSGATTLPRRGATLGILGGIDYAFSRSFALGVSGAHDRLGTKGSTTAFELRAEYRWGW
ncbi:MAG: hypothetical protein DIU78_008910 [Pseudomonadota bacterium]|nr:MAG: hypothetical protein DIU78_18645 [Pseudomonadota bacterium]